MGNCVQAGPAADAPGPPPDWQDRFDLGHPLLHRLAGYWDELRGDKRMPRRGDIEPWRIPDLLPHIWMWSYETANGGSLRFRLAGEEILRAVGYWPRGTRIEEMFGGEPGARVKQRYLYTVQTPAIGHIAGQSILTSGARIDSERLILPLGDDGCTANAVLGVTFYDLGSAGRQGTYHREDTSEQFLPLA